MRRKRVKKEASIFQIEDPLTSPQRVTFEIKVSTRIRDERGIERRVQRQARAKNITQARILREQLEAELRDLRKNGPKKTFQNFEPEFLAFLQKGISEATFQRQEGTYRKMIFEKLKNQLLSEVTTLQLEAFIDTMMAGKRSQTRKHFTTYLRKIFQRALLLGYLKTDPMASIRNPRVVSSDPKVLNDEQAGRLLRYLKQNDRIVYPYVAVAIYTAMRIGEIKALTWRDVDFTRGVIHVNKTVTKGRKVKRHTKTGKDRTIPINNELRELLVELRNSTFGIDESPVMPEWRESNSGEQAKVIRTYCIALGLPAIRFHDLRATALTSMFCHDVPIHVVQLISGHESNHNLKTYLRIAGRSVKGATDCLTFFSDLDHAGVVDYRQTPDPSVGGESQ